jgi:hypothetical protein
MPKKAVRAADLVQLNVMGKIQNSNNAINAYNASGYLFGKPNITALGCFSTGSNYGWWKTIPFGNYAKYQDTALLRSPESRIIGLSRFRKSKSITRRSNI